MYKILFDFLKKHFSSRWLFKVGFNLSPMYRRSCGRVIEASEDLHRVKVRIKLNWKNINYAGTMFAGSMLSASDPVYMIQLIQILGNDYVVWDKAVKARFRKPAKSHVYGDFVFTTEEIDQLKKQVAENGEIDIEKELNLVNRNGDVIAELQKTIYISTKTYYKEKLKRKNEATNRQ